MTQSVAIEKRHQVFVSSTYTDLVTERQAVIQALLELDCIPAGMEMFPAADEDQWSLITEVIDQCDYYIVVVGGRYGSVSPEGVSYTEKEYDYAVEQGLPILGFVHADPGSIPVNQSEIDKEARESLEAFRSKVMSRMVKAYSSPDELSSVVSRALVRAIRRNPRPGWVRGDHAMTDAVRAEIAELRAALAEAEKKQSEAVHSLEATAIDESFEHGGDKIDLNFWIDSPSYDVTRHSVELTFTWDEIVEILGPYMMDESSERQLRGIIGSTAMQVLMDDPEDEQYRRMYDPTAEISADSWGNVLVQLRALGIMRPGVKKRTVSDKEVYWTLTPAGDAYVVRLKARKRQA